jgi:hypothetical protein
MRSRHAKKTAFANKLKAICYDLYGWAGMQRPEHYDENPVDRETILPAIGKTPREIWIEVGNQMRKVYEDVWIDYALRAVGSKPPEFLIITDLRYPNEMRKIKQLGGVCIKIDRPEIPKSNDVADTALEGCTEWDRVLLNDGTKASLNEQMCRLADEYLN